MDHLVHERTVLQMHLFDIDPVAYFWLPLAAVEIQVASKTIRQLERMCFDFDIRC
jgi:hypothetical protein